MNVLMLTLKHLSHEMKPRADYAVFDTLGAIHEGSIKCGQKAPAEMTGCTSLKGDIWFPSVDSE